MGRPTKEETQERIDFMQSITDCAKSPSTFSKVFLGHDLFDYNIKYYYS